MADSKISALTGGGAPQDSDKLAIARSGASLSLLFSDLKAAIPYVPAHAARVKRASGNVSIGNNTFTVIPFTAEDYDTDSIHDNTTNNSRLTIPTLSGVTTGLWGFSAMGYTDATSAGGARCDCEIRLNGSTLIWFDLRAANSSGASGFGCAGEYVFSAADYIELLVRTTDGSSRNVIFDAPSPTFEIHFLGKVT